MLTAFLKEVDDVIEVGLATLEKADVRFYRHKNPMVLSRLSSRMLEEAVQVLYRHDCDARALLGFGSTVYQTSVPWQIVRE